MKARRVLWAHPSKVAQADQRAAEQSDRPLVKLSKLVPLDLAYIVDENAIQLPKDNPYVP